MQNNTLNTPLLVGGEPPIPEFNSASVVKGDGSGDGGARIEIVCPINGARFGFSEVALIIKDEASGKKISLFEVGAQGTLNEDGTVADPEFYVWDSTANDYLMRYSNGVLTVNARIVSQT